jgi:hypothetical protein
VGIIGLLLLPVAAPVMGFRSMLEWLHEEAEAVRSDEGRAFAELIDLSMRHNAGQLSDAEYAEQEVELLERLNSIREYSSDLSNYDSEDEEEEQEDSDREQEEEEEEENRWLSFEPDADEERR